MSVYPGNTSLASAVKEKVKSTFQQTLALYRQGRSEEVIAGCNLILQMDPMFDPAKRLLEKAKNPASPLDVDTLTAKPSPAGPLAEARTAMAARDFPRVIQITTEVLTNDLMNDEARLLADEAREKIEANPFIEQFVRKCEKNVKDGNLAAARTDLEKARALDSTHPGVSRIEEMIKAKESGAAVASSSFVVDTPNAPARSTTQASDFGFTFEEEKPAAQQQSSPSFANFSFDTPAPPAAPAAPPAPAGSQQPGGGFGGFSFDSPASSSPGGFSFDTPAPTPSGGGSFSFDTPAQPAAGAGYDFSTASIETTPDDQKKIEQYLSEGDRAFEGGNYQQAIDLWSRIFLIDVTNEAASERIERAKGKRRESEQRIETILAAGVQAFERNDVNTARAKLGEVLQLDPNNVTAQDYLERLDMPAAAQPEFSPSAMPSFDSSVIDEGESATPAFEIPSPTARKPSAPARAPRAAAASKLPMGLIAAVIAAVVLIGGGWFVWSKFVSAPKADAGTTTALLDRATEFSQQGKYDQAMATLQEIKPGDPQYDKALGMIADLQQKKTRQSQMVEGRPAVVFYEENVNAGRTAFESHDYVSAKKAFEQAMRVKPLPPDVKPSYDAASQQVAKLDTARALFGERKYADVITSLQPMLQQDPQNKNLQRMIIDAHFNLGATALQEERIADAKREFDEVLKSDPNDELARRSKDLAERYDGQTKDLLYRIYVKYLPLRAPAG
jgi:tetratricopeptide (TPR) repeat protein